MNRWQLIRVGMGLALMPAAVFGQGSLTPPPGAPGPVMRTLEQVEPRIPISSAPYTITNAGAYYLTTNLTVGGGADGITILANDVDLDLNGFVLSGAGGGNNGIASIGGQSNVRIRNGTVRNWGLSGVNVSGIANGQLENLLAFGNAANGIYSGPGSTIVNCSARSNADSGIAAGANNTVSGCTAMQNAAYGINALQGSTVVDCTAGNNSGIGIFASGPGCTISRCTARQNGSSGITGSAGTIIQDCTAASNAGDGVNANALGAAVSRCTSRLNGGAGIVLGDSGTARDNTCSGNNGHGITAVGKALLAGNACADNGAGTNTAAGILVSGNDGRIERNHITGNDRGLDVDGTRNHATGNTVLGNTDNYDFAAGNQLDLLLGQIPESIDWPAAVQLAGSLTGIAGTNGVTINADGVTLDLGGHALNGVGSSHSGVFIGSRRNVTVMNGTISGWGANGVSAYYATNCQFRAVASHGNAIHGFFLGQHVGINGCTATRNGGFGFSVESDSLITDSSARENVDHGFNLESRTTVLRCQSIGNTNANGFFMVTDCLLENCQAELNEWGMSGTGANTIRNCNLSVNSEDGVYQSFGSQIEGCKVQGNDKVGIRVESSCRIMDCFVYGNQGDGIKVTGFSSTLDGNTCRLNGGVGLMVSGGTGNLIIRNNSSGNSSGTNFMVSVGNPFAVVSVAGSFTNTNPWVNFSH